MIGKKIKERRLELNMTQDELAKRLGYKSRSTINKIELDKNDVSQSKLIRIAKALECSPTDFLNIEGEKDPATLSKIQLYAEKLSKLSPSKQANVMKYIDFLYATDDDTE